MRVLGLCFVSACAIAGYTIAIAHHHKWELERACAWAERADMYDDCAKAFNSGGSRKTEGLRHWYGDPSGE